MPAVSMLEAASCARRCGSRRHIRALLWVSSLILAVAKVATLGLASPQRRFHQAYRELIWQRTADGESAEELILIRNHTHSAEAQGLWLLEEPQGAEWGKVILGALELRKRDGAPRARELLTSAAQREETRGHALAWMARGLHAAGHNSEALQVAQAACQANDQIPEAWVELGTLQYFQRLRESALSSYRKVAELTPHDPRPYATMANVYLQDGYRRDRAVELYLQALNCDPRPRLRRKLAANLGECLMMQGQLEEALDWLAEAPIDANTEYLKARCAFQLGDFPQAQAAVQRSLQLDPQLYESLVLAGELAIAEGKFEQAMNPLRQAIRVQPGHLDAYTQLAVAQRSLGERAAADETQRRATHIQQTLLQMAERSKLARHDASNIEVRLQLAENYIELANWDNAESWFRSVLIVDPRHAGALEGLKRVEELRAKQAAAP